VFACGRGPAGDSRIEAGGDRLAGAMGIVEEVLPDPMRIYRIEHGIGSGWTPEGHNTLMERINRQGIDNLVFADPAEWWRGCAGFTRRRS
jgi:hypothetical protein